MDTMINHLFTWLRDSMKNRTSNSTSTTSTTTNTNTTTSTTTTTTSTTSSSSSSLSQNIDRRRTIIYCMTVDKCKHLHKILLQKAPDYHLPSLTICLYHGRMSQQEQEDNHHKWSNDAISVMVATSAFNLGVDANNVKRIYFLDDFFFYGIIIYSRCR
jgi:superfamily II DNA helicase RecQ